ncbi:MAG TPA: hypothetical protein VHI31_06155 [Actinomycetota bacterium]|nr:hypothetical protein [Actinomycetota bacterium]
MLLLLAALGSACSTNTSEASDTVGTLGRTEGSVELVREGTARPAAENEDLFAGDLIRVEGAGTAYFRLGDSTELQLARGSALLRRSNAVRLTDATLLISSDQPVEMDLEALKLSFKSGSVRLELPGPGRVAAYEVQDLLVTSGSQQVPLPQLWQLAITEDGRLDQARPLQFSRDDPIDAAQLEHAIEVDGKLGNLLRGVEPQLAATDGGELSRRIGEAGVSPESLARFTTASRSDKLMALAFAREWKKDAQAELAQAFEQALALKVLGASWGLVAQNFGVDAEGLVTSLQAEINAVLFPQGMNDANPLVPAPVPSVTRPAAGRTPQATGRPAPAPAPPPAPAPAPAPGPGAPSPAPTGLIGPVIDPLRPLLPGELEAIVDELYGLVNGLVPLL